MFFVLSPPVQPRLDRILFVDDEAPVRSSFRRLSGSWGLDVDAVATAAEALQFLEDRPFDVGVLVVDLHLEGGSGLDLLEMVAGRYPWITRVLVSGALGVDDALDAINRGRVHRALKKPWSSQTLREALRLGLNRAYLTAHRTWAGPQNDRATGDLDHVPMLRPFLEALALRLEAWEGRNPEARCRARLCRFLGEILGLDRTHLDELELGALAHDLGRLFPGGSCGETMTIGAAYADVGAALFAGMPGLERVTRMVQEQDERFDGMGYPEGLRGAEICLEARILRVALAFLRLASEAPDRMGDARESLAFDAGGQFDPMVVEALLGIQDTDWARILAA
ncbi:MAG: HD domain-containing phosphohydrolase [Myxococcota bacterium]